MAEGIQVFNNSNIIQVDANYKNLELISVSTVACNATYGNVRRSDPLVLTGRTTPILAFRDTRGVASVCIGKSGSTFTFTIYVDSTTATTVEYFLFDVPQSPSANFGFQVFNSSSELCFDATRKYMRVLGFGGGAQGPFTGNQIVVSPCAITFSLTSEPHPTNPSAWIINERMTLGKVTNSNTLSTTVKLLNFFQYPTSLGNYNSGSTPWIVIDINNFGL